MLSLPVRRLPIALALGSAALLTLTTLSGCAETGSSSSLPALDAGVSQRLDEALTAVRALPGVGSATRWVELHQTYTDARGRDVTPAGLDLWNEAQLNNGAPSPTAAPAPGADAVPVPPRSTPTTRPTPPAGSTEHHVFSARIDVVMEPGATAAEAGAVPPAMDGIGWTGVDLYETLPAAENGVASVVTYDGTFDQTIPVQTATDAAAGAMAIAAAPGVTWLSISIPTTMRIDYGQLDIEAEPDIGADGIDRIRQVVAQTVFRDTTTHGALPNGAKP